MDIVEHGILVVGGQVARKSNKEKYPIDRQPLLDLLGLIIFTGLFFLGANMILQSLQLIISVFISIQWVGPQFLNWIGTQSNNDLLNLKSFYLITAAIVMFFSFVISEFVYRFQIRLATEHKIIEMKADAKELRSDGRLELGLGLGLIFTWILNAFFFSSNNEVVSTVAMSFISLVLGGYLLSVAIPEFYENYKNLMNHTIKPENRIRLEAEIDKRLPENCKVISPLVAYHRGAQIFVKGYIQIDRNLMSSSDVIVTNCEKITNLFLSETGTEIHSQFSPLFNWSENSINEDLNKLLKSSIKVDTTCSQSEAFRLLKFGKFEDAINLINWVEPKTKLEEMLGVFVIAECNLQKYGANDPNTKSIETQIREQYLDEGNPIFRALFLSWLLTYYSKLYGNNEEGLKTIVEFQKKNESVIENNSLPDYIKAEVYFALGYSWERRFDYDLEKCRQLYSQAEYHYTKSTIRSEVDRLMNSMGHLETLLYSLGDAEIHLNLALDIRQIKKDKLGLSYTNGSLGDLYTKMGIFKEANNYYTDDFEIISELKINHFIPSLNVKRGELSIRIGIIENDVDKILAGIEMCQNSEELLSDTFFATKGIVKGYLCLASLADDDLTQNEYFNSVTKYLSEMTPNNTYQTAFYRRLKGRYEGSIGNNKNAQQLLNESAENFKEMKDPMFERANGIQNIVSSIEAYKWENYNNTTFQSNFDKTLIKEFQEFIQSQDGMLGNTKNKMIELIENISKNNHKTKKDFLKQIDLFIWTLEG